MSTPIYTKTFQVTVGQLHCFEIDPLGTFSMLDAPDPCTFARSNCWKPFSLQNFEFQTASTLDHRTLSSRDVFDENSFDVEGNQPSSLEEIF